MMSHVLLEAFCTFDWGDETKEDRSSVCVSKSGYPSYQCFWHKCPHLAFTSCENAICYVGEDSMAEEIIMFGGEMEHDYNCTDGIQEKELSLSKLKLWESIAKKKVNEAYDDYMDKITKDALE